LKSGLVGRFQGWNQAGLKKKQGKKKPCVTRLTRLTFIFLLKQRRYDLKKKKLTRSKPETQNLDRAGHRTGS
jgi:hypothetical protein